MGPEASFHSDLANMLYNTPADPAREAFEVDMVERIVKLLDAKTSNEIFRHGAKIDAYFLPMLSGRNYLQVAKYIEARAPAAIAGMPRLRMALARAQQAAELSQILSPVSLTQVIKALRGDDPT
jgi:hypothetical protein